MKRIISIFILMCFAASTFSQESLIDIEPNTESYIPSWAKNARRTSIITLGSVPFTTLTTTLVYSMYRYIANDFNPDFFPNPFPGSSSAAKLNTDEQIGIILASVSLSVLIGLTDLIVTIVNENKEEKKVLQLEEDQNQIIVIEAKEDQNQIIVIEDEADQNHIPIIEDEENKIIEGTD